MLDVTVIGGGPVGSLVAYQLAVSGYRVIVIEKRSGIGEKLCCTGIISQDCVSTFNIPPEVISRKINSAKLFSPSGEFIRIQRPEVQACIIDRPAFDRTLARKAQAHGVEYQLNSEVKNMRVQSDSVRVDIELNGRIISLESRAAILATGFKAPLVKQMGFGETPDFVTGVQTEVQTTGIEEIEVYFDQRLAPGFFAWLVPTTEGRGLAGLMSRNSPGRDLRDWLINLESQGKITIGTNKTRYGGIPIKPLPRTFADRMLVVGDAAGQVKPTTGGGIYFGMLSADMAAQTIHNALQTGDLSAKGLSGYERSWRKKLSSELKGESLARELYRHLSDKQINTLISRAKSSGIVDSLMKENISFDWHGGLILKVLKAGLVFQARRFLNYPLGENK